MYAVLGKQLFGSIAAKSYKAKQSFTGYDSQSITSGENRIDTGSLGASDPRKGWSGSFAFREGDVVFIAGSDDFSLYTAGTQLNGLNIGQFHWSGSYADLEGTVWYYIVSHSFESGSYYEGQALNETTGGFGWSGSFADLDGTVQFFEATESFLQSAYGDGQPLHGQNEGYRWSGSYTDLDMRFVYVIVSESYQSSSYGDLAYLNEQTGGQGWSGSYAAFQTYLSEYYLIASESYATSSYGVGVNLNEQTGGLGWSGSYADFTAYRIDPDYYVIVSESFFSASYGVDSMLNEQTGGFGWSGSYFDTCSFVDLVAEDNFESYSVGIALDGLNTGSGWSGAWRSPSGSMVFGNVVSGSSPYYTEYDQYVYLTQSLMTRQLSIGNNWNKIRISLMMAAESASATFNGELFVGMSSGTGSVMGDGTVTHAVGLYASGSYNQYGLSGSTALRPSVTGSFYRIPFFGFKQSGSSINILGVGKLRSPLAYTNDTSGSIRQLLICDITKNNANESVSMSLFARDSGSRIIFEDISSSRFQFHTEQTKPTIPFYHYDSGSLTQSFQTSGFRDNTDGILDSVNIYWRNTEMPIRINGIKVYRLE